MTEEQTIAPPAPASNPFLPYGVGGDFVGARRSRRAFRFLAFAAVALTGSLYFAQGYLRYDLGETKYRMALTLEDDSQRAILRNVVLRDQQEHETPNPRYVEALAAIEEADVLIERYEEAYQLNPKDPSLLINFGCRLFLDGQYKRARDTFREAGLLQPPRNALPRYLEAAALLASDKSDAALREASALVARANSSRDPVLFPRPLWHESLPKDGSWYVERQRDIVNRCCAPLYRYREYLLKAAARAIEAGQVADWDMRLSELQRMGERLLGTEESADEQIGLSQAVAGVQFQLDAIAPRMRLSEMRYDVSGLRGILEERANALSKARELLHDFDNSRQDVIERRRERIAAPLRHIWRTAGLLFCFWFAAVLINNLARTPRTAWSIPHARIGRGMLSAGIAALLALLLLMSLLKDAPGTPLVWLNLLWNFVFLLLALSGLAYPFYTAPRPAALFVADDPALPKARKLYRTAWLTMLRRYYGLLFGGFIMAACVWLNLCRLAYGLYPTEVKLLTTGLRAEELELIRQVQELLL